jgi:hypothetical protein
MDPSKTYRLLAQVNQRVSEVLWAFVKVVNPLTFTSLLEVQAHLRHQYCLRRKLQPIH